MKNLHASALYAGLLVGTIGFGYFIYGKKSSKSVFMLCGALMCIASYLVQNAMILLLGGAVIGYVPFLVRK